MRRIFRAMMIFLPLLLSCGVYTFNPKGKSDIKTIAVQPFDNKTPEFGLTDRLTEIVVDAFIADGTLKVVSAANADALLTGTLVRYERVASVYDTSDIVQQYKVIMSFDVALQNPKDQTDMWKEQFTQEGPYEAATQTEEDGQKLAGKRLVEAVLNKTTKSW
ncbi:MAG: LptE family protein [Candidatus Zixiibacteriota bacterium]